MLKPECYDEKVELIKEMTGLGVGRRGNDNGPGGVDRYHQYQQVRARSLNYRAYMNGADFEIVEEDDDDDDEVLPLNPGFSNDDRLKSPVESPISTASGGDNMNSSDFKTEDDRDSARNDKTKNPFDKFFGQKRRKPIFKLLGKHDTPCLEDPTAQPKIAFGSGQNIEQQYLNLEHNDDSPPRNPETFDVVSKGGIAGETAVFSRTAHSRTAIAARDTYVVRINRSLLQLLSDEYPESILNFTANILSNLAGFGGAGGSFTGNVGGMGAGVGPVGAGKRGAGGGLLVPPGLVERGTTFTNIGTPRSLGGTVVGAIPPGTTGMSGVSATSPLRMPKAVGLLRSLSSELEDKKREMFEDNGNNPAVNHTRSDNSSSRDEESLRFRADRAFGLARHRIKLARKALRRFIPFQTETANVTSMHNMLIGETEDDKEPSSSVPVSAVEDNDMGSSSTSTASLQLGGSPVSSAVLAKAAQAAKAAEEKETHGTNGSTSTNGTGTGAHNNDLERKRSSLSIDTAVHDKEDQKSLKSSNLSAKENESKDSSKPKTNPWPHMTSVCFIPPTAEMKQLVGPKLLNSFEKMRSTLLLSGFDDVLAGGYMPYGSFGGRSSQTQSEAQAVRPSTLNSRKIGLTGNNPLSNVESSPRGAFFSASAMKRHQSADSPVGRGANKMSLSKNGSTSNKTSKRASPESSPQQINNPQSSPVIFPKSPSKTPPIPRPSTSSNNYSSLNGLNSSLNQLNNHLKISDPSNKQRMAHAKHIRSTLINKYSQYRNDFVVIGEKNML